MSHYAVMMQQIHLIYRKQIHGTIGQKYMGLVVISHQGQIDFGFDILFFERFSSITGNLEKI